MASKVGTPSHHIGFLDHFSKLEDPRQINKSLYPLQEGAVAGLVGNWKLRNLR